MAAQYPVLAARVSVRAWHALAVLIAAAVSAYFSTDEFELSGVV